MSLILDALKRADRERQQHPMPASWPVDQPEAATASPWQGRLLILAALIIALLSGYIVRGSLGDWRGNVSVQPEPVIPAAAGTGTASVDEVSAEPAVIAPTRPEPPASATDPLVGKDTALEPSIAGLYQRAAQARAQPPVMTDKSAASIPGTAETVAAAPDPALVAAMEAQARALITGRNPDLPVSEDRPQVSVVTRNASAAGAGPAVPDFYSLPWSLRRAVPTLDYAIHVHSDDKPAASFVRLNGQIRRVGDTVAAGLRLDSIDSEGIILDFQGTRFRLPALNSWVNN